MIEEGAQNDEHDTLWSLHKTNLARANEGLCAGAGVADHERGSHHKGDEDDVEETIAAGVVDEQAEKEGDVRVAIHHGVEEGTEDGDLVGLARDAAVHHVKQAGTDDDQARVEKHAVGVIAARIAEEDGGHDVDEQANEGQGVRRDARKSEAVYDLLQQPTAAFAELAGPGHCGSSRLLGGGVVDGRELEHLQLAFSVRCHHCGDVAEFLADERAADGRGGRDEALGDVRLLAGDELVGELFVLGRVEDNDGGAEADLIAWDVREVDHSELAHALLELAEAGVDELLTLLGGVVLGIF